MTRTLSASVLAISIAIGGFAAAPAQASHNDIGKIAVGAAAALLIAKAVENNKKRQRAAAAAAAATPARTPHYHSSSKSVHVPHAPKATPRPIYAQPVYQPPVYQQPPVEFQGFLPSECQFDVARGNTSRSVYSKICLGELMVRAEAVPAVCEDRVTTSNGRRTQVYDSLCLQARGYADEAGQYN